MNVDTIFVMKHSSYSHVTKVSARFDPKLSVTFLLDYFEIGSKNTEALCYM